jgi:hypothetical protein
MTRKNIKAVLLSISERLLRVMLGIKVKATEQGAICA